jgi:DNA helicase HerA-like ATPase
MGDTAESAFPVAFHFEPYSGWALETGYFRPIRMVHSFSKLFSKIIANRLPVRLGDMVRTNQSAFVRRRCLHDNLLGK